MSGIVSYAVVQRVYLSVYVRDFSAVLSAFYPILWNNGNQMSRVDSYNVILGNIIGYRGSISTKCISVPLPINVNTHTSTVPPKHFAEMSHHGNNNSIFLSPFGAYESRWGLLTKSLNGDVVLVTGGIYCRSYCIQKQHSLAHKWPLFVALEKFCLMCELTLN